ncbi:MAG TPA: hypothetical protein VFI15_01505, partial [Candidatus Limnocylindrales bacterium]|nr:hypothetical protein [Candidatus Limnocylindrales bacterium]
MVEYGGAINNGPAGQVAGSAGGNAPDFGSSPDVFASVGHVVNDATSWLASLPFEMQVAGIIIFFAALLVVKRAF